MMRPPIDLLAAFDRFTDQWSPKAVAAMNDYLVRLVRVEGTFVWHSHPDTDELFLVLEGTLDIEIEGRDAVTLQAGQLFVVPAGVRHRPVAESEAKVLLLEPTDVVNTGDAGDSDMTVDVEWLAID